MKKVLSLVLVLALVLGSFSMAFATDVQADVTGKTCEKAVQALQDLGVVNGYNDGTFKPENTVTRAEAAKMIIAALGLTAQAEGNTTTFADCQGHWAAGYIGYAQALGVLKGRTATTFDPNGLVSYQEILTMIVRAVGYTDASLPGTWPANYVAKAKALGLLKDVEKAGNASATRGDVAIMIYNNLENPLGYIDNDNAWVANYPTESMLSRLDQDDILEKVVLTDNGIYTVGATTPAGVNYGFADGTNLTAQYGVYGSFYVNDSDEITGIKKIETEFLTGKIKVNGTGYDFVTDDETYEIKNFNNTVVLFDNGRLSGGALTAPAANTFLTNYTGREDVTIAAKVSGKTIKAIYSATEWNGQTIQWDDSLASKLAKKDELDGVGFTTDKNKEIDLDSFTLVGAASLDKIPEDAIVTYYVKNKITKVEVSTKVVEGEITKVKGTAGADNRKWTINGTEYKVNDGASVRITDANIPTDTSALSSKGKWFLNYAGKIVKFDGSEETNDYALVTVTAGAIKESGKLAADWKYLVKMVTADGKEAEYELDDTNLSPTALTQGALFAYSLDDKGVIDEVKTFTGTDVIDLAGKEYTSKGYLAGIKVSENVVIFKGAIDDVEMGSIADLGTNKSITAGKAVVRDDKVVAVYITSGVADDTYAVINGKSLVKNSNDKTVTSYAILVDGKEVDKLAKHAGFTPGNDAATDKLVKVNMTGDEITSFTVATSSETAVQVTGLENGSIKVSGGALEGYQQVADNVVVYQVTLDDDDAFDAYVVSTLKDIRKGDYVWCYETDDDNDGFDVIIWIDEDDKGLAAGF